MRRQHGEQSVGDGYKDLEAGRGGPRYPVPMHAARAFADRSRTSVLTRTGEGLLREHDHRHEDGSPGAITRYGHTVAAGS